MNLSWNSLGNEDNVNARLLKKILMTSPHLIHVNVAFTGLNDSDVILIIEGAKGNKNLMSLHLGGNEITPPALERMSQFLKARKEDNTLLPAFKDTLGSRIYTKSYHGCQCN